MTGVDEGLRARRARRTAVLAICATGAMCAAGAMGAVTAPALAKKPARTKPTITTRTPVVRGSAYLALGDSVTFGYEEDNVAPAPNYQDASSFSGYPELVGSALHLKVANAACPGETAASLVDASAQSFGCENAPGGGPAYRKLNPLHVSYGGSQLAFAVTYLQKHHDVRLVSLMIGANDGFLCQQTTPDHCASFTEQAALIAGVNKNVKTILSAIRNRAHYRGQLAIVNYYSLDYSSATTSSQSALLNQAVDSVARPFHVVIADGYGELQAAATHAGGNTCTAGLLTQLGTPGKCGIHPSYAGQSLLAQALEKVIRLG
jgi:lysophospholipase L1-like esterase